MAGWKEVVFKGGAVADLGVVGVAEGNLMVAGGTPFTYANFTAGTSGKVLTAGGVDAALTWETPTPKVGTARGSILQSGADPFTYAELGTGSNGEVLTSGGAGATLSWTAAGTGDFKADGTVPMTAPLRLKSNAGEGGMGTVDGSIFFDTTADKVKVYVA